MLVHWFLSPRIQEYSEKHKRNILHIKNTVKLNINYFNALTKILFFSKYHVLFLNFVLEFGFGWNVGNYVYVILYNGTQIWKYYVKYFYKCSVYYVNPYIKTYKSIHAKMSASCPLHCLVFINASIVCELQCLNLRFV